MSATANMVIVPTARPGHVKVADDLPESTYESSLSTLARNVLQEKSPRLFEYEVGFELLEKSDDGDRAVGVFGFKVGPEWLYAPVIFDNGAVKGTELLYVKSMDQFVPLSEGWVDAFLRKKPSILGQPLDRSESRVGVGYPDLLPLIRSPFKMASAKVTAAFDNLDLIKLAEKYPWANKTLRRWINTYPAFKRAFSQFYDVAGLPALPAQQPAASPLLAGVERPGPQLGVPAPSGYRLAPNLAVPQPKPMPKGSPLLQQKSESRENQAASLAKIAAIDNGTVEVITKGTVVGKLIKLTADDVQRVIANDYDAKDTRKETSMVVPVSMTSAVTNPSHSGRYDVMTPSGEFKSLLIVVTGDYDNRRKAVVLDVSSSGEVKAYGTAELHEIWVRPQNLTAPESDAVVSFANAIKGFPAPAVKGSSWSGKYMLVGPDGQGFGPFRIKGDLTDGDTSAMEVDECYCPSIGDDSYGKNDMLFYEDGANKYWGYGVSYERRPGNRSGGYSIVVLTGKPGLKMVRDRDTFLVPDTYKMLTLETPKKEVEGPTVYGDRDKNDRLMLGRPEDLMREVYSKSAALTVDYRYGRYEVGGQADLTRGQAVAELMVGWDLREEDSLDLLKQAEKAKTTVHVFPSEHVLKMADDAGRMPSTGIDNAATAPDFPEVPGFQMPTLSGSVPANMPYESAIPADPGMIDPGYAKLDMYAPPEGQILGRAMQAAQSGHKEVFDVGSFSSMAKEQSDETMIDDQLPDLMKALDSFGTLLFNLYYHKDAFEDRYGKGDLAELEGTLRSAFKSTGEGLLFLKQKSIRSFPGDYGIDFGDKSPV